MERIKDLTFSTYAKRRLRARRISLAAIKTKYERRWIHKRRGTNGGIVYRLEKDMPGYRLLTVAEVKRKKAWIATACRLRGSKGKMKHSEDSVLEIEPAVHAVYLWLKLNARVAWTYIIAERPRVICAADLDARGNVVGIELIGVDPFNTRKVMGLLPEFLRANKLRFITAEAAELLNYGDKDS